MINKKILITEKISLKDLILKYTLRDFLLGILNRTPASIGVFLRMVFYKFFLKKCGKGLIIRDWVTIKFPERVVIGNHVGISEYTLIDGDGGIEIGEYTRIASHVSVVSFGHNYERKDELIKLQGKRRKGIKIGRDVWIGAGVRILDGVEIGDGAIVGAGSVVKRNIPSFSVAVGVPAKVIKERK
ncbi:hypothetical protein COV42_03050 [Candidatus Campbellbacteria bacterium CG11_big_fil_rev_8_21_14_0_20_44_21]|uniref:Acetyltransferase n=1 Tax=Candidatus Campbellbacteria bacterium CG22_combo_CG10-13_8_21_14_all_43_18 TaxID=1974530 RepID=A0A2H0DWM6_9BACT|nr:MAG: hypothetical protein COW82_01365 [Candidatus Campbellbacteria bacterium CG22_combo_CG10-13_8_21_14_all_43_18]PIR24027.1 MAG: hypothetical protein COV42_03050 [Candidatus Campbellbacteria bacterium CG11_big_fil_rev_8_21_14_0_20_44_21]